MKVPRKKNLEYSIADLFNYVVQSRLCSFQFFNNNIINLINYLLLPLLDTSKVFLKQALLFVLFPFSSPQKWVEHLNVVQTSNIIY